MPPIQQEESHLNFCGFPANLAAPGPAIMEHRFSMSSIPENEESIEICQLQGKEDNCLSTSSASTSLALLPNPFDKIHDCEEIDIDFCHTPSSTSEIEVYQQHGCEHDCMMKSSYSCEVLPGAKFVNGDNTLSERNPVGIHRASIHGDLNSSDIAKMSRFEDCVDEVIQDAETCVHIEKPMLSRNSSGLKAVNWGDRVGIQCSHVSVEPPVLTKKTIQYSLEPVFASPTRTKSTTSSTYSISTHRKGQSQSNNRHGCSETHKMCISSPPLELLRALQAVETCTIRGNYHDAACSLCPSPFPMFPFEPHLETIITGNFDPYNPVQHGRSSWHKKCHCGRLLEDREQSEGSQLFKGCKYCPLGTYMPQVRNSLDGFQPVTPPMSLSSESQSLEEPRARFLKGKMNCCFPRKRIQPKPSPQETLLESSVPESTSQPSVIQEFEAFTKGTCSPADTSVLDASQACRTTPESPKPVPALCVNVGQCPVNTIECSKVQVTESLACVKRVNACVTPAPPRPSCSSSWFNEYSKGEPPGMFRLMIMAQKCEQTCDPVATLSVGVQEGCGLQPPSTSESSATSDHTETFTASQEDPTNVGACCQQPRDCCFLAEKAPPCQQRAAALPGASKDCQALTRSCEVRRPEVRCRENSRRVNDGASCSRPMHTSCKGTGLNNLEPCSEPSTKGNLKVNTNHVALPKPKCATELKKAPPPEPPCFLSVATSTSELPHEQCCGLEVQDFSCQSLLPMMSKMCQCNQLLVTGSKRPEIASKAIQSPDPRRCNADMSSTRQCSESFEDSGSPDGSCTSTGNPQILYIGIASRCKQKQMSSTSSCDGDCEALTHSIRCLYTPWKGCRPSSCLKDSDEEKCTEDGSKTQPDCSNGHAGITKESPNSAKRCTTKANAPRRSISRNYGFSHQDGASQCLQSTCILSRNALANNAEDSRGSEAERCFSMSSRTRNQNENDSAAEQLRLVRVDIDDVVENCGSLDVGNNNHRRKLSTESEEEEDEEAERVRVEGPSTNTPSMFPSNRMLRGSTASADIEHLQRLIAVDQIRSIARKHHYCHHFTY